jgi:uncharacterized membrane protein
VTIPELVPYLFKGRISEGKPRDRRSGPVNVLLLVRWFHLLAATLWVGGMLFLVVVLVPQMGEIVLRPEQRVELVGKVGERFSQAGWLSVGVLAVTGTVMALSRIPSWGAFFGTVYGRVLALKLVLVGTMVLLSVLHDFVLGPRLVDWSREGRQGEGYRRLHRRVTWLSRLNLLLALGVLLCVAYLTA